MSGEDVEPLQLTPQERGRFREALTQAFHTVARITSVLDAIGFPLEHRQGLRESTDPAAVWIEIFNQLDAGALHDGYRLLLEHVHGVYGGNPTFRELQRAHPPVPVQIERTEPEDVPAAPRAERTQDHHVMIRAANEHARQEAEYLLNELDAAPSRVWTSNHVTLFRIDSERADKVLHRLDHSDLVWTMIEPGQPTYLLSQLTVHGPDGRAFRFTDVPAQSTVGDIAAQTMENYPRTERRGTVTDRIGPDGQGERLPADASLDEARVPDGAHLRVGHEVRAGAVNPLYREEALAVAGNQIRAFVAAHEGFSMWADAPELATVFELEFTRPSLGPPPGEGDEPVDIDRHVVQIELGPGYPTEPPHVFWLTEIFHPNIYPNYDSDAARERPQFMGLACMGDLSDSYRPGMNLGELCQAILDLAGFANYDLFEATGAIEFGEDGAARAGTSVNFLDAAAAQWVRDHSDRVDAISGGPPSSERRSQRRRTRGRLPAEIELIVPAGGRPAAPDAAGDAEPVGERVDEQA
jgi:hypothetical protein